MKNLRFALLSLVLLILTQPLFAQSKFGGEVIEVRDGKTVVIETVGGNITVALQYIEIPEPDQPLNKVVAEHLKKLVLGKVVEFRAQRISTETIVGELTVAGKDVSQQMLRDGAAWHIGRERTGQDMAGWAAYNSNETQAKNEKLGVWSVPGMKTAWQHRADKEEAARQAEIAKLPKEAVVVETSPVDKTRTVMRRQKPEDVLRSNSELTFWPEIEKNKRDDNGILKEFDLAKKFGSYETKGAFLTLSGPGGETQRVETRSLYVYQGTENATGPGGYVIGFLASTFSGKFQKSSELTFIADGKKISLGKGKILTRKEKGGTQELLLYRVDEEFMQNIAYADKLEVRLGAYSGSVDGEARNSMRHLMLARK